MNLKKTISLSLFSLVLASFLIPESADAQLFRRLRANQAAQSDRPNNGLFNGFFRRARENRAARQNNQNAQAENRGNNNGGNTGATHDYIVEVKLSRADNRGSLRVINNSTGAIVLDNCPASGGSGRNNHPDGAPSRLTPSGDHRVDRTSPHLDYRGQANAIRNVNSTYFTSIFGRPVAVHTGNTNTNSHACVRTSARCSAEVMRLANLSHTGRRFNTVVSVRYY